MEILVQRVRRALPPLKSVLVLTLTLICGFAYLGSGNRLRAVAAQSTSPSGSFGFLVNAYLNDSSPDDGNGTALLGVMNFDEAGNVTGPYTLQNGATLGSNRQARTITGTFTGIYSGNRDGTGSVTIDLDRGLTLGFATVITEGGKGMQLVSTSCPQCGPVGANFGFQGTAQSITGVLPMAYFFSGATGGVNFSLPGVTSGDTTVYSTTIGTGSGTLPCSGGSTGNWTASVSALTLTLTVHPGTLAGPSGDFLLVLSTRTCGATNPSTQTLIGPVSGNFNAGGALSLGLRAPGFVISGIARAMQGDSPSGSYGFQISNSPAAIPGGTIGVMNFDGAGNVAVSFTTVGSQLRASSGTTTGTYSINPDGRGTITLTPASGQFAAVPTPTGINGEPTFAFVAVDGGSQLLLLQSSGNLGINGVAFGTAQLQ